ncbi:MAG: alpha-rhamnosidase [Clostridia bacterium]|nr:alpha-rhamnosidase [Clostridia bacterium]
MNAQWIWYPGDFEIRHYLLLHTRRQEYDVNYPAVWHCDSTYMNVRFSYEFEAAEDSDFTAYCIGNGYVQLDGVRYPFGKKVGLSAGKHSIMASVINDGKMPAMFIDSKYLKTNGEWKANNYDPNWVNAGTRKEYTKAQDDPNVFPFKYRSIDISQKREINGGVLYDFGRQTFAKVRFSAPNGASIYYGESETEALDTKDAYIRFKVSGDVSIDACAFRYLFIKGEHSEPKAEYEYLPIEKKAAFKSCDELLDKIYDISEYTFELNSREFFLDGIKRDRWCWSGDAYQSYFVNDYLYFDTDITRRTMIALRGKDPVLENINTILDYSLYWVISLEMYYNNTGDKEFIRSLYPKLVSMMEFLSKRIDEKGFITGKKEDWTFIDWAQIDKTGAVCAEQMLLARAYEAAAKIMNILDLDGSEYIAKAKKLLENIDKYYWNEEKGAYIDSFESGKNKITRHANIFAHLFGYADEERRNTLIKNVIKNDKVPAITTPYFKFFELDAMCAIGDIDYVINMIRSYWGGMVKLGCTTFWEEYVPEQEGVRHYEMYGMPYGKSLCHAWSSSPIYLLGRYVLGVYKTDTAYNTYCVEPYTGNELTCYSGKVPLGENGIVKVERQGNKFTVVSDREGGKLILGGKEYEIRANEELAFEI